MQNFRVGLLAIPEGDLIEWRCAVYKDISLTSDEKDLILKNLMSPEIRPSAEKDEPDKWFFDSIWGFEPPERPTPYLLAIPEEDRAGWEAVFRELTFG